MNPNPTLRLNSYWPLVLTIILLIIGLIYPSRVWITLFWVIGGMTIAGYYWAREMAHQLVLHRERRGDWVQVGDRLEERFTLINNSWLPMLWGEVDDESTLPDYRVSRLASCGSNGILRWMADAECKRRGIFTLGPWSLRTQDPFGFFSVSLSYDETDVIVVYPPVVHLPEISLPRGLATGSSRARRRVTTTVVEATQTRYYVPGYPLHQIHWPSTAHKGELVVREAEDQVSGSLWIVLDLEKSVQAGKEEESTEEYGVILAASLADKTLHQNRAVGVVAHGAELAFVPLGRGKGHMWHILRALATVQAGGTKRLADVLHAVSQNMRHGTTVLIITPSNDPDWIDALFSLSRRGIAPTVVLLDAESFAPDAAPLGRAQTTRARLVEAGIKTHMIQQGYPFRYTVPPKARGHWEFKVTPMGRAIAVRRPEEA